MLFVANICSVALIISSILLLFSQRVSTLNTCFLLIADHIEPMLFPPLASGCYDTDSGVRRERWAMVSVLSEKHEGCDRWCVRKATGKTPHKLQPLSPQADG